MPKKQNNNIDLLFMVISIKIKNRDVFTNLYVE